MAVFGAAVIVGHATEPTSDLMPMSCDIPGGWASTGLISLGDVFTVESWYAFDRETGKQTTELLRFIAV